MGQRFVTVSVGGVNSGSVITWYLTLTKSQPPCLSFTTQQLDYLINLIFTNPEDYHKHVLLRIKI